MGSRQSKKYELNNIDDRIELERSLNRNLHEMYDDCMATYSKSKISREEAGIQCSFVCTNMINHINHSESNGLNPLDIVNLMETIYANKYINR